MKEYLNKDQRLVLLRSLRDCNGSANESILQTCLHAYGHKVSRDTVKTHIHWLSEQSLITVNDIAGCLVVSITQRGADVAQGFATVPGVNKPGFSYD